MKLVLDGAVLTKAIKAVNGLVPEATLTIDKEGVRFLDMDPSNVAMVNLNIPASSFADLALSEGKDKEEISIKLSELLPILKRVGKDDIVSLTLKDDARLRVSFSERNYEIPLIDIEDRKEMKEPELSPEYSVTIKTNIFKELLDDASIVSESIALSKKKGEELKVLAEGELKKFDSLVNVESTPKEAEKDVSGKYSIEYLNKMVSKDFGTTMTMAFASDYPLKISFRNDNFTVSYILAPRINSD
jgi:proliferating cell nuclear antigen